MDARAQAHDAFAKRDWRTAYDAFHAIDDGATAADYDALGECAYWLGLVQETIDCSDAAYRLYVEDGHLRPAALSAFMLAVYHRLRGEGAMADGWLARCERLLVDADEGPEHGYPLYLRVAALMGSDLDAAVAGAREMHELGRRFDDHTLVALGVFFEGRARIKQARVQEGRALLDEAMLAALSDNLKPMWTGAIYCGLLDACHELGDVRRAGEWAEVTRRWCDPLPVASLYPGICRVHWAGVLQMRGAWEEAEAEALAACEDVVAIDVFAAGDGYYEVGEIRRRRGDLKGAEDAYERAHALGRDPQPGLALLRLAQHRTDRASSSIAAALAAFGGSRLERAPLLAAQVEIALASGNHELAGRSAREVEQTAEDFDSPGVRATAARCRGAVCLAGSQGVAALTALRQAVALWQELDAPYESARARVLLAEAYLQLDDTDAAKRESAAARTTFERLGASIDLAALQDGRDVPCGLTAREVQLLGLLATGLTNREIAERLVISEKTVARHVANIFVKIDVSSRSAATAFAYANDLVEAG